MNNQQNPFFFKIKPIPKNSRIFDELEKQELFFCYFQIDKDYYIFFYAEKFIDIDVIDPYLDILEELDTKKRKIRSFRGFFSYVVEIMNRKNLKILTTNLKPSFWRGLKTILRQNKKEVLLKFLFGSKEGKEGKEFTSDRTDLLEKVKILESKVASLQAKVKKLEKKWSDRLINGSEDFF